LRFTFVVAAYLVSTSHSSGFARLAPGAFSFAIAILTFYEVVINKEPKRRKYYQAGIIPNLFLKILFITPSGRLGLRLDKI
jgi:bacteriorhodopsin